jgi:hypothetical protein
MRKRNELREIEDELEKNIFCRGYILPLFVLYLTSFSFITSHGSRLWLVSITGLMVIWDEKGPDEGLFLF